MTLFDAIGVAGTGVTAHRKWLDAVSDNLANINTVRPTDQEPFRARFIQVTAASDFNNMRPMDGALGKGVIVTGTRLGNEEGRWVYEPDHALADEDGYVIYPEIDLGQQMTHLLMAQRGYQASLAVVDRAKQAYEGAIQLGKV